MSTITSLQANDSGATSRTAINTNLSNLNTDKVETSVLDTDTALTANSDLKVATQKATKAYADTKIPTSYLDIDTTLAANSDTKVATQKATKAYVDSVTGIGDATTSVAGIVEVATQAEVTAGTATGGTGASLAVTPETLKNNPPELIFSSRLGGTIAYSVYCDSLFEPVYVAANGTFRVHFPNAESQYYDATADYAGCDSAGLYGSVLLGDYIYLLLKDTVTTPDTFKVFRYAKNDMAAGGTEMTIAGQAFVQRDSVRMTSNGTDFFFSYDAGTSANMYDIAKYSLSGTTLTYVSTVTCGSTAADNFAVKANGDIYILDYLPNQVWRYNSSGTLQWTSEASAYQCGAIAGLFNYNDTIYMSSNDNSYYHKVYLG